MRNTHKALKRKDMKYLPIAVKLKNKRVLVVGAGKIAERKIDTLLAAGADLCVVSPRATRRIKRLYSKGYIKWVKRYAQRTDIRGAKLIVAATNNARVNKYVSQWSHEFEIPINVVDKPAISNFISPAIVQFKNALIAVYTDGKDPVLSRDLKNYLKETQDDFVSYRSRL